MTAVPVIHLDKPLAGITILHDTDTQVDIAINHQAVPVEGNIMDATALSQDIEQQKHLYQDLCSALEEAVSRLNQLYEDIFVEHSEAIARLSLEIARKVVMRNINDGDYEIESIIQEALKKAPENTGLVVRLNPEDLKTFRQLQDSGQNTLSNFDVQADPSIGKAECIVESSKGIIQLLIDEHLERISKALAKTG